MKNLKADAKFSTLDAFQRLRECIRIVIVLVGILLAVALLTFDPKDPSWSQAVWGNKVHNAGGVFGAWSADILFTVFGQLAYLIPLVLVYVAFLLMSPKTHKSGSIDFLIWGSRTLGLALLLLTSCGLIELNANDFFSYQSGGIIGAVIVNLSLPTLNLLGSLLVFMFCWCAGFTLVTGISWLNVIESVGRGILFVAEALVNRVRGSQKVHFEFQQQAIAGESENDDARLVNPFDKTCLLKGSNEDSSDVMAFSAKQDVEQSSSSVKKASWLNRFTVFFAKVSFRKNSPVKELTPSKSFPSHADIDPVPLSDEPSKAEQSRRKAQPVDTDDREQKPHIHTDDPLFADFSVVATEPSFDPNKLDEMMACEPSDTVEGAPDTFAEHEGTKSACSVHSSTVKKNPFLGADDDVLVKPKEPLPTLSLLYYPEQRDTFIDQQALESIARLVEEKLADYKIDAQVVGIYPGPVITRLELDLAAGIKVSRISSLSQDLARSLSAAAVRVIEVIPGKPYVGLELPNLSRQTVYLSDVIGSQAFQRAKSPLAMVLGEDIAGEAVVADLAKMPHVLVAGTTGSGKSVGVNVMILSILYKATPDEVRFIMIDPKMLELSVYEGIPHLLSEVVTDMKDASNALRWCVGEMERRYKLLSELGVRSINGYNDKLKQAAKAGHPLRDPLWQPSDSMDEQAPLLETLPSIVVVVDEFADLMMVVGKKVEELIARLAQKARAAGIHLILATQRPSVDVITGLIKANIPTRIAFTVSTKTDSRTILDQGGAETLLGMGDMLYLPSGSSHAVRVHGAFASDEDVHAVVNNWKARAKPNYLTEITSAEQSSDAVLPTERQLDDESIDPLFDQVVDYVLESRRGSVSGVQRRFKIGYNRAARIVEQLEEQGIVSAPGHNGNREVLAPAPNRPFN